MTDKPTPEQKPKRSRALRTVTWFAAAVVLLILGGAFFGGAISYFQENPDDLQRVGNASAAVQRWGFLVQCLALAAICAAWKRIVDLGLRTGIVKAHEYERVLAYRWRVFVFGVAYLLLVVLGPARLWNLFTH